VGKDSFSYGNYWRRVGAKYGNPIKIQNVDERGCRNNFTYFLKIYKK